MSLSCPRCGHSNPGDSIACMACGEPLNLNGDTVPVEPPPLPEKASSDRTLTWMYIGILAVLTIGVIGYRLLSTYGLQESSALFIGLPAIMGALLALTPKPKSNTGIILRVISLGLFLSGPILAEGFICILMSAPLFLGVGLIIGLFADAVARKKQNGTTESARSRRLRLVLPLPLLLVMSLEGTTPELSFSRAERVTAKRTVNASAAEVENALKQQPRFHIRPTGVLGIGFPIPLSGEGSELSVGSRRVVHFSGGEGRPPGDLSLEVVERSEGYVRFQAIADTSHLTHWLHWTGSEIHWTEVAPNTTEVTWTIQFNRGLDPAWYFGLPERWVVQRCVDYLITTCATP